MVAIILRGQYIIYYESIGRADVGEQADSWCAGREAVSDGCADRVSKAPEKGALEARNS
jgi:hypothetical protein